MEEQTIINRMELTAAIQVLARLAKPSEVNGGDPMNRTSLRVAASIFQNWEPKDDHEREAYYFVEELAQREGKIIKDCNRDEIQILVERVLRCSELRTRVDKIVQIRKSPFLTVGGLAPGSTR